MVRTLSTEKVKAGEEGADSFKFSRGNRFSIAEHQESRVLWIINNDVFYPNIFMSKTSSLQYFHFFFVGGGRGEIDSNKRGSCNCQLSRYIVKKKILTDERDKI